MNEKKIDFALLRLFRNELFYLKFHEQSLP